MKLTCAIIIVICVLQFTFQICFMRKQLTLFEKKKKLITQTKCLSQTHDYYSLKQENTHLWEILLNRCEDTKYVNTLKEMIVKYVN